MNPMDDKLNRLKFARINLEAQVKVTFSGVDARRQLLSDNISTGGLFIVTDQPKAIGTVLKFEFIVRDGGPTIEGSGVVRWVENHPQKPKGMGIKFVDLNEAGREEIKVVLKRKT